MYTQEGRKKRLRCRFDPKILIKLLVFKLVDVFLSSQPFLGNVQTEIMSFSSKTVRNFHSSGDMFAAAFQDMTESSLCFFKDSKASLNMSPCKLLCQSLQLLCLLAQRKEHGFVLLAVKTG